MPETPFPPFFLDHHLDALGNAYYDESDEKEEVQALLSPFQDPFLPFSRH